MQRAARAAEARGAEAQRKIDRDKDILLVEEELARLDALDRARRKVGRSENKLMFSSAVRIFSPSYLCDQHFERALLIGQIPANRNSARKRLEMLSWRRGSLRRASCERCRYHVAQLCLNQSRSRRRCRNGS
jgi:hypothetical protein